MNQSWMRSLEFWSAVIILAFIPIIFVLPLGILVNFVISLLVFGLNAGLQAVFSFYDIRKEVRIIFLLIGGFVLVIGCVLPFIELLFFPNSFALIILWTSIALLLDGLHWFLFMIFITNLPLDKNRYKWLILTLGLLEIILVVIIILVPLNAIFLAFGPIVLSAINLILSSILS
ncbi:MAG: hypothetical protein ACFFD8_04945 [Candidatus Thorarchaeota archaeon]